MSSANSSCAKDESSLSEIEVELRCDVLGAVALNDVSATETEKSSSSKDTARHSDSQLTGFGSSMETGRRQHSKSFSLSDAQFDGSSGSNLFQQNRELWEKRAEKTPHPYLTGPRILTRNRIAPDLVMDLPFSQKDETTHSSRESLDSGDAIENVGESNAIPNENGSGNEGSGKSLEDMTTAERFATQNQCTLKKNERFAGQGGNADGAAEGHRGSKSVQEKPRAEVKPQEATLLRDIAVDVPKMEEPLSKEGSPILGSGEPILAPAGKNLQNKSPIPLRNTQKFVSKFADLHLTGGCMASTAPLTADAPGQPQAQSQPFSSFKPQVKVKPSILRKPLVLPPTTPEMMRRNHE